MENIKLQFCGNAKIVQSDRGEFMSISINKELLAKVITEFQNSNPYIELCIGENREHREDEKSSHYVYSHPKYQGGELRDNVTAIRLYKEDLEKIPNTYKTWSVSMTPNTNEKVKADYNLWVKQDGVTYAAGVGYKPQEKANIILCGNLSGREGENGKYFSASFDKIKLNELSEGIFKNKDYIDLSVAENRQHKEGEISSHYVYSALKHQNATDRNMLRIMDIRLFKADLVKIPVQDEYQKIFAFVSPNKNKEKPLQSDFLVVVKPDRDKDESFLIGVGYIKNELRIGTPVHFHCKNPVLEFATKSETQAAFGVIDKLDDAGFVIESPAGQYVRLKSELKPASQEDLDSFISQFADLEADYKKSISDKAEKIKETPAAVKTPDETRANERKDTAGDTPGQQSIKF